MSKRIEPVPTSCAEVREALPAYVRDRDPSLGVRRHLAGCPACRAELAGYERLLGAMGSLRSVTAETPAGTVDAILAIPSQPSPLERVRETAAKAGSHVSRHRVVYAGTAAAAVAGAGAMLWRQRARRVAPA